MRAAVLLPLLSGCLIVDTYEEGVGEVCPEMRPEALASAAGPLAVFGDQIYYERTPTTLSRISTSGGAITDLVNIEQPAITLVVDASGAYWGATDNTLTKAPLTGAIKTLIAYNLTNLTNITVDDVGLVYAAGGLFRVRHADNTTEMLAPAELVSGLAQYAGTYFFADVGLGVIRRAPPVVDLAFATYPGPVVVDDRALYYYEYGNPNDAMGAIRVMDPNGGEPMEVVSRMFSPVVSMVMDADNVFYATDVVGDYRIKQLSRASGEVKLLACNFTPDAFVYLAQDDAFVYWSDTVQIYRAPKVN